jgi:hypothetical protein
MAFPADSQALATPPGELSGEADRLPASHTGLLSESTAGDGAPAPVVSTAFG